MIILDGFLLENTYSPTPVSVKNINYMELGCGEYSGIHCTEDTNYEPAYALTYQWDKNTVFSGDFSDSINLSNVAFSLKNTSDIVIKKREKNTFKWTTLLSRPVKAYEDFEIIGIDIFNAGNTIYEYALIPVFNGTEGSYDIVEARSDFDGLYILEKDTVYGTLLDIRCDTQRNHSLIQQQSLSGRYPRAIHNSAMNYESGIVSGYFCRFDHGTSEFIPNDSISYRKAFVDFLTNKKPKILKLFDGRIWLVNVDNSTISDSEDGHWQHRITSFGWYESGDCRNEKDLYDAGLIDVEPDFWSYDA